MTPAELVAWLRGYAAEMGCIIEPPTYFGLAADLIERAYPPPGGVSVTDQQLIDGLHSICQPGKWVSWKRDAEIVDLAVARIRRDSLSGPSPIPQPPPGCVRVRVAVQVTGEGAVTTTAIQGKTDDVDALRMCRRKQEHDPTHQAILVADIPSVQVVPEVPARVEEVPRA